MKSKKIPNYTIIIGIVIAIIVIFGAVFIFAGHLQDNYKKTYPNFQPRNGFRNGGNFSGNFTLNQTKVNETALLFQSSPTLDQLTSYCGQNRIYCGYYCRTNPSYPECMQLFNSTNFTYRNYSMMNFSRLQGAPQ